MRADGVINIELSGAGRQAGEASAASASSSGEIETQINAIEGIEHGAVIAKRDRREQAQPHCFLRPSSGRAPGRADPRAARGEAPRVHDPQPVRLPGGSPDRPHGKARSQGAREARDQPRRDGAGVHAAQGGGRAGAGQGARAHASGSTGLAFPTTTSSWIGGDSLLTLQYLAALSTPGLRGAADRHHGEGRTIRGVLERVSLHGKGDEAELPAVIPVRPDVGRKVPRAVAAGESRSLAPAHGGRIRPRAGHAAPSPRDAGGGRSPPAPPALATSPTVCTSARRAPFELCVR